MKERFLHHGTILFDTNLENLVRSLNVTDEKIISKGIQSVRERVTNIRPFLTNDMDSNYFRDKMIEILKGDMEQEVLNETDLTQIDRIEKENSDLGLELRKFTCI